MSIPQSMLSVVLSALIAISSPARSLAAQQASQVDGIAHVAFLVTDVDRSRAFLHKLGFEESFLRTEGASVAQVFFKINDRQFIELYPRGSQPPQLAHACLESGALEELHAAFDTQKVQPSAIAKGAAGNLLFSTRDPEDRTVEFTQYMPGSWHMNDAGKHLGPDRISNLLAGVRLRAASPDIEGAYYGKLLGAGVRTREHVRFSLRTPGEQIELIEAHELPASQIVFGVANLQQCIRILKQRGIPVRKQGRAAFIHDPDGNVLLFAERPADW